MYMEELATLHKTDDGKHVMMVKPKKKESKPAKNGETMVSAMEEPKSYVASTPEELHCLVDEHIFGKKKTKESEFEKGWKTKE